MTSRIYHNLQGNGTYIFRKIYKIMFDMKFSCPFKASSVVYKWCIEMYVFV